MKGTVPLRMLRCHRYRVHSQLAALRPLKGDSLYSSFPQGHLNALYNAEGVSKMITVTSYVIYVHTDCHRFLKQSIPICACRGLLREVCRWLAQAHQLARDGFTNLIQLQKLPPPQTETTGGKTHTEGQNGFSKVRACGKPSALGPCPP